MSRRNLHGNYTQSTRFKDICILLVNDDCVCQTIVAGMLDHCRYEAFSYEREMDALNMIWERKDVTELVLTNVHRTYAKRHGITNHIEKQIQLKVLFMSPGVDDMNVSTLGGNGVSVYFMKCLSENEMNNLWGNALAREKNKRELSSGKLLLQGNAGNKIMLDDNEQLGNIEKKPRVVWTKEMHQKFLEAVAQLGDDKAFPKKIVELMNVPGLTRANVASHLQKYRMCMKRAQEGFTSSPYDFTNKFGLNTVQESFQQSPWNPFQIGSRNTTTTHFNLDYYKSRSRTPSSFSLLKTIQFKPSHNFNYSVYGDQTKNILLRSIEDNRVQPNTSFAGFRFASDGKSVVFGQNSHLASSVQQQFSFPETGNGDSTICPSFLSNFTQQSSVAPSGIGGEPVSISSQLSSLADLLAVDEPMPAAMTQLQPSAASPGFDWNKEAAEPPSFVAPTWSGLDEQLKFTCEPQLPAVMTPPQSAGLQWTEWAEPPGFSSQQLPSGNTGNAGSDIYSDFTSSLPEFCELGAVVDDIGVDATAISDFDALLFDNQELT